MAKLFESKNPFLSEKAMEKRVLQREDLIIDSGEAMTMEGAINKTLILLGIMAITTFISFVMPSQLFLFVGIGGGLIAVLVAVFKPSASPIAAPVYAAFEGLFVGSISAIFAYESSGIVMQAVALTMGTLLTMLIIYRSGLIKVTEKFKAGILMATGAIMIVYLISFFGSFVGFQVPYLHDNGMIGIGISLFIIAVAALNLILDFDAYDKGVQMGAPKYMEWYVSLGLIVTLVWLYLEFLRLLSKFSSD